MSDPNEFHLALKYKNRVGLFTNFASRQEAVDFRESLLMDLPNCKIMIGKIPIEPEIFDFAIDFEEGRSTKIAYCKSCGTSKYVKKLSGASTLCICAECGNNTWN